MGSFNDPQAFNIFKLGLLEFILWFKVNLLTIFPCYLNLDMSFIHPFSRCRLSTRIEFLLGVLIGVLCVWCIQLQKANHGVVIETSQSVGRQISFSQNLLGNRSGKTRYFICLYLL